MDEALERIRAILDEEGVKPRNYTVSEAIERLRREEVPRFRHPRKALSHIRAIERYAGTRSLASLAELAVQYRLDHPGLAVATCNRRLAVLRRVARLAHRRWGWLNRPVYVELAPEHNQRHRYLTLGEVERLLDACAPSSGRQAGPPSGPAGYSPAHVRAPVPGFHLPTRDAVLLAVYTGMRQGEIFALDRTNVRGDCLWLPDRDSKNREPRLIPILPPMIDAVARLPLPCTARYMWGRFKRACAVAGLADLRFHDLRHTTASLLINAGYSLKMVGEVLGHRSVQSANRYAHLAVSTKRAALERVFGV